jgi:hypothetical protein
LSEIGPVVFYWQVAKVPILEMCDTCFSRCSSLIGRLDIPLV